MPLALWMIAATTLAQPAEPPPPPPTAPLAEDFASPVPDDQVPFEDKAPPEYPRVVRQGDQICQQSVKEDGTIGTVCRPGRFAPKSSFPKFTTSFGALGVFETFLVSGATGIGGGFDLFGEIGARLNSWAGVVLVVDFLMVFSGGSVMTVAFAPGFRLGGDVHFTLSLGPSVVVLNASDGSATGVMGTLLGTGVFPVAGPFSLFAQAGLTFNGRAAFISAGGGAGVSF